MGSSEAAPRKLRILMLHGYTQSGHLFDMKTKALQKSLAKAFPPAPKPGHLAEFPGGVDFYYPTAPVKLDPRDIPGFDVDGDKESPEAYGWWRRKDQGGSYVYYDMERGVSTVADALKSHGPFHGVIGFSQGAAFSGMVASLLEDGRREVFDTAHKTDGIQYPDAFLDGEKLVHPPLRFAVSYSGFRPEPSIYRAFYEPKIKTPLLHFIGSMDTVVSEERSLRLVEACENARGVEDGVPRVVYHPGGHFVPQSNQQFVAALVAFIKEAVGESSSAKANKEESVEDMDLPF